MSPEFYFLIAAVVAVVLIVAWRFRPLPRFGSMPYRSRNYLLSKGEQAFYQVLLQAIPAGISVCLKVRVADLVDVGDGDWHTYGRPVAGMHIDFVLVDTESSRILCCIELDDKSHSIRSRQERDAFIDAVLASAEIPLVRVKAAGAYQAAAIRKLLPFSQ